MFGLDGICQRGHEEKVGTDFLDLSVCISEITRSKVEEEEEEVLRDR